MLYSFGGTSLSAPMAAPRNRRDTLEEAWAALAGESDALLEPRDAVLESRDALAIRRDAVRRRGRDSRRVTRSSRSSPRARSISEAASHARRAALAPQGDASRASRDAVDEIRDARRREDDAHGETGKPVPASTESSFLPEELALFTKEGWLRHTRGLLCVRRPAPGPRPASQRPRK
jgi:hypothetical protein